MASTATPYGLRPVNMIGGQAMSHGIRLMRIASAYATSIFNGDLVTLVASGFIEKCPVTADASTVLTNMPVGVFLGVEYETQAQGLLHRQMWTASTATVANKSIWAYVCDDPDALFAIQASATLDQASLGINGAVVQNAGNSTTGNSAITLNAATVAVTAAFPLRVVDFVERPGFSTVGDAFTDVIVKLNHHRYRHTTAL